MELEPNGTTYIPNDPGDTSATIHNQQCPIRGQAALPSRHSVPKATVGCDRLGHLASRMAKQLIEQAGKSREWTQNNSESRRSNSDQKVGNGKFEGKIAALSKIALQQGASRGTLRLRKRVGIVYRQSTLTGLS
jgi:hypothetical protein